MYQCGDYMICIHACSMSIEIGKETATYMIKKPKSFLYTSSAFQIKYSFILLKIEMLYIFLINLAQKNIWCNLCMEIIYWNPDVIAF